MSYGLSITGFLAKTLLQIRDAIHADQVSDVDARITNRDDSLIGVLNAIVARAASRGWQLAADVYRAFDPDGATGDALAALCALTGVIRLQATKSTVTATVNLDDAVTLPAGSIASVSGNSDARFVTLADVSNATGVTDDFQVDMEAEETGPTEAMAGTLTEIETPVSGWNSITNALDADTGRDVEEDDDLRLRRESLLRATGGGTAEAIRAGLLEVDGVTSVSVFVNETMATDSDGIPPRSFECLVLGGADQDIADKLWSLLCAAGNPHGVESETVTDSQGFVHTMYFTRPTESTVEVDVTVTTTGEYPTDGDAQIAAAIKAQGDRLGVGDDVVYLRLYKAIFGVSGVLDVTTLQINFTGDAPGTVNLPVGARGLATFDTSDITVTS